jgi:chromosomal replication initiation ATPase DnaA
LIEQTYVTERGRKRRRQVRVDLEEVRRGLGLPTVEDRGDWAEVRDRLLDAVGESTFEIWLDQVELIAVDSNRALVLAVNEQTGSWVRERFGRLLSGCVERAGRDFRFATEPERRALEQQDPWRPAELRALRTDQKEAI